jgi:hypothetical protein
LEEEKEVYENFQKGAFSIDILGWGRGGALVDGLMGRYCKYRTGDVM